MQALALSVSVTANGNFHLVGSVVTLTTTVTPTTLAQLPPALRPSKPEYTKVQNTATYTYTYTARRVWPCQETIPISGNGPSTTWTPAANKPGDYELAVTALEVIKTAAGSVLQHSATGTTLQTIRRTGLPVTVKLTGNLKSVNYSAKVSPPAGGPYTYRFRVSAAPGGTVDVATAMIVGRYDGDQSSISGSFNWEVTGSVHVDVTADAISKSDCMVISGAGSGDHTTQ
jgi:hypothetical protein